MSDYKPIHTYKAIVSYIGRHYCGFQLQPNGNTIQAELEKAFKTILRHKTSVLSASRTDSGVHAERQVLAFKSSHKLLPEDWLYRVNSVLPSDICVKSLELAKDHFDPINEAKSKIYRYRIWRGQCTNPFLKDFVWPVSRHLDLKILKEEILAFQGLHDFSSFCSADSSASTRIREILEVHIDDRDPLIDIWIRGRGFLKQMVRIIIGTLIDIDSGRIKKGSIPQILKAKNRELAGQTAPPEGLSLVDILYENEMSLITTIEKAAKGYCLSL